ncbi:MAG TPA: hypothetical protein VH349_17020 [Ktedonobacterales bacterium]
MNGERRPRQTRMTPDDELLREPLYPKAHPSQPAGRIALLSALAALLVLVIAGTTALVVRDLRLLQTARASTPVAATATTPSGAITPNLSDPQSNGWTPVSGGVFTDVQFTQSGRQRGYLCGMGEKTNTRVVGVTTDGGDTWQIGPSPAGYDHCSVQVSATNPLDVALLSSVGPCGGCTGFDTHYSTDGGRTWKAAPFPQNTQPDAGAAWAGQYLYIWADPAPDNPQQGFLKVSANGGAFTAIDPNSLVPGASGAYIYQMIASGAKVYVTLAYNGCSSAQGCTAAVASGDGGKTWARITNTFNMHVVWVAGTTLYGEITGPGTPVIQASTDNGASWNPLALPPLPGGHKIGVEIPGALLPADDGTVFALDPLNGSIAYLRDGVWTSLPFSSQRIDGSLGAVTFGPDGRPQRVWVFSSLGTGGATSPSLYWHTTHIV